MINRVLIIGSGSIALKHFKNLSSLLPKADIKIYSNFGKGNLSNKILLFSLDEAIDFLPNLVIIANASTLHIEFAKKFADIGSNLLIEKPISNSYHGVEDLIKTCRENKIALGVGYNLRFSDSLNYFRSQIESEVIGKPLLVKSEVGQYLPTWRPNLDYRKSVSSNSDMGGGALLELSHEIDYISWIFGNINWVRATVMKQSSLEIDVEDSAFLILGISNEYNSELVANLSVDFIRHDKQRNCVVIGELGSLKWDGVNQQVSLLKVGSNDWETLFTSNQDIEGTYIDELSDFIDCIINGSDPKVSGMDGLKVLRVIDSILESAPTGMQTNVN